MDMTGEYRIAAPREAVWAALNDAEVLRQAIPGCEEIEKTSPTEFTAKVTAKVGPVKARFGGKVTLSDLDPPNGYRISGEGQGGAAGFAKGGAEVRLTDDGDGTVLHYTVNANVGGKLAQIGSRLIDGTARKMAEEFFGRFAEIVTASAAAVAPAAPPTAEPAPVSEPVAAAPAAAAPTPLPARAAINPTVWIVGLIAVAVLVLLVFATPR
ncbi:MAG: carbon monoxide dehydrogenase subunit G [Alphaproteobacteria bacterium]|nr:carbon monoxide dehydrogenase subunit G [Alphaproteobacteria bacterium]